MTNTIWRYLEVASSKSKFQTGIYFECLATAMFFYQLVTMVHTALPEDKHKCKKCGSSHVDIYEHENQKVQACLDCGFEEE